VKGRSMGLWVYESIGLWVYRSMLCAMCSVLVASVLHVEAYAGENEGENEAKDEKIDLPPVNIEVVDTMQLDIPREKFRSFTKPDSANVYAPLSPKERPWYLPPTSIPGKLREVPGEAERDFLFSLAAHSGVPAALAYQMLLVRGFGANTRFAPTALLNMGRATLKDERTARLASDPSKRQGSYAVDRYRGAFANQSSQGTSLKMDVGYDGKDLSFLDVSGERYPNDRSLTGLSVDWDQKLSDDARSSLNIGLSRLKMEGPLSSGSDSGLDLKTHFGIRILWPGSNPVDAGLGIGYFAGENDTEDFREAILRLYLRDNYIRMWRFVLGAGMELLLDARRNSSGDWEPHVYPNPCVLLMSRIGNRTVLQFGIEGYILRQDLKALYLDRDYMRFTPDLNVERTWDLNASLQYRLKRKFTVTAGAFGKEIKNLTIFEETSDEILSWKPNSRRDNARIFGFNLGWELSLMDGRVKQNFEYIHESHHLVTRNASPVTGEEHIPYRPRDRGSLTITYFAPFGLEPSISAEFYGTRYVDTSGKETLSSYALWKPRLSKTFGKYASVFLAAEIYSGQDEYQLWRGYKLPDQIVDFGLTLKF